jgi:hypothetical protein
VVPGGTEGDSKTTSPFFNPLEIVLDADITYFKSDH